MAGGDTSLPCPEAYRHLELQSQSAVAISEKVVSSINTLVPVCPALTLVQPRPYTGAAPPLPPQAPPRAQLRLSHGAGPPLAFQALPTKARPRALCRRWPASDVSVPAHTDASPPFPRRWPAPGVSVPAHPEAAPPLPRRWGRGGAGGRAVAAAGRPMSAAGGGGAARCGPPGLRRVGRCGRSAACGADGSAAQPSRSWPPLLERTGVPAGRRPAKR